MKYSSKVLHREVSGGTVTFEKESAFDLTAQRRSIYGAIRFLPPPYSSFHLVRGGWDAPSPEMLRQIRTLVLLRQVLRI
jgi:hypothetical protein